MVWAYLFANTDDEGSVTVMYVNLLSQFKVSRTTLQRIIDYGVKWAESGQKVGRKWADKELTIKFLNTVVGQKVGRKWAESGQAIGSKTEPIANSPTDPNADHAPQINLKSETKEKAASTKLFPLMVEAYDEFCQARIGMGAKMNAHQGKAMKSIAEYLGNQIRNKKKNQIQDEALKDEVLLAWKYILNNWGLINGYYAEQIKLSQIDSNLPNLLVQLRKNKNNGRDAKFAQTQSEIRNINFDSTE